MAPGTGYGPDPVDLIARRYGIPADHAELIYDVALIVGGNPNDLAAVMWHESRMNPQAQFGYINGPPGGKFVPGRAVGLIQFTDAAARTLGITTRELFDMDFVEQMEYVEAYLQAAVDGRIGNARGLLDTRYKMALAVFYPGWRDKPSDSALPEAIAKRNGVATIGEYVDKVLADTPSPTTAAGVGDAPSSGSVVPVLGLGAVALGLLWMMQPKRKQRSRSRRRR